MIKHQFFKHVKKKGEKKMNEYSLKSSHAGGFEITCLLLELMFELKSAVMHGGEAVINGGT